MSHLVYYDNLKENAFGEMELELRYLHTVEEGKLVYLMRLSLLAEDIIYINKYIKPYIPKLL